MTLCEITRIEQKDLNPLAGGLAAKFVLFSVPAPQTPKKRLRRFRRAGAPALYLLPKQKGRLTAAFSLWQGQKDLNPRHAVLETAALPTELYPYMKSGHPSAL